MTFMPRVTRYILAAGVIVVVIVGASLAAAEYTGRTSFCVSCHEMQPYGDSWRQSAHADTECTDCHIPKGTVSYIKTKAFAFREVYVHVRGQVKVPLAVTREIPNSNCSGCHDSLPAVQVVGQVSTGAASADIPFDHAQHSERCVACHVRFVHATVTPPAYVDPTTMDACFACHDGAIADETCALCHAAPHDDMGPCDTCHGLEDWVPTDFDHPFPLKDAHATARCADCHTVAKAADGSTTFGEASPECGSCHTAPHEDLGACDTCHVTKDWAPTNFDHPFPLEGAHAQATCGQCHEKVTNAGGTTTLGTASPNCVSCHKDEHGGLTDCGRCHSPAAWTPADFSHPGVGEHIYGGEHGLSCRQCHPSGFGSSTCAPCHSGVPRGD